MYRGSSNPGPIRAAVDTENTTAKANPIAQQMRGLIAALGPQAAEA